MAVIIKNTDRVKLKIGEVEFQLSPLSYGQKISAATSSRSQSGGEINVDMPMLSFKIVKYAVKGIKGVKNLDGSVYKLDFEKNDFPALTGTKTLEVLTDECAEELVSCLSINPSLNDISYQLLNGIPDHIVDHEGKRAKGVSLEIMGKQGAKRKKAK